VQSFQGGGQIENNFDASEIFAANSPESFNPAQGSNGIPIKVIAVVDRYGRRRDKAMFAIN
jgi:hypothetical protein